MWLVCLLFAIYFALSVSVTRLRAELGFPAHSLWHATPYFVLLPTIGSAKIDPRSSTIFAIYRWFNFDWASHPMPHQLEGFKFADHTNTKQTKLPLAIMTATVVGTLSFFGCGCISLTKKVRSRFDLTNEPISMVECLFSNYNNVSISDYLLIIWD